MLLVDAVLYFLLTIYFDNVIQGEYGTAKPFWFCLSPAYWVDKKGKKYTFVIEQDMDNLSETKDNLDYEPVGPEMNSKIALRLHINSVRYLYRIEK